MGNIVLLDDLTINKIAAGEVIERPASVVKELVENSIDAGATKISVEIKNGGISYIRITDNGKGIMPDDMEMPFERHATSKIRKAEDLDVVTSMGFRGEALASIAAISHVEVISKAKDNDIGYKVEVEGGNILNKEVAGCSQGTTMTVTNLFFNTPVRYKFLKKDFTEAGYVEDVITRIALVHPEIAIKLISSGKTVIQTPGNGDMRSVVYNIYGKDVAENIIEVDYEYEDVKVTGVIGKPVIARSNRSNQLFFVNDRYVKDKTLSSAAEQAYKGLLTIGKYSFLVLNIHMDPRRVDVNVHPAKLEVRFQEESKMFKAIYHTIKDGLLKANLVPDKTRIELNKQNPYEEKISYAQVTANLKASENSGLFNVMDDKRKENIAKAVAEQGYNSSFVEQIYTKKEEEKAIDNASEQDEQKTTVNEVQEQPRQDKSIEVNTNVELIAQQENTAEQNEQVTAETKVVDLKEINEKMEQLSNLQLDSDYKDFDEMYAKTFGVVPKDGEAEKKEDNSKYKILSSDLKEAENLTVFEEVEAKQVPTYKFIGIVFTTYIIIEMDNEIYMIDQHAAHERVLYEKVKENFYSDSNKDSQLMLLPDIINLSHKEMQIAKDNIEVFRKAGFTLEEFGENTIKLSGVPNICIDLDTKELFLETLDEINTVARTAKQEIEDRFIATVACKAAVKANMVLSREEVDKLLEQLLVLPNPFTCPHGRPTAIKMTRYDIERKFSRR